MDLTGSRAIETTRYVLAYRADPRSIEVGKHFALEFVICPLASAPPPEDVRVDAHMPAHRHGMNYKASVTSLQGGRYRAEGLMFHMPGNWEFVFDLRMAGKTERLTQNFVLE